MTLSFPFLPTNLTEAKQCGYNQLDVILVTADAYVDHPAFATAIIGRYLQSLGLRVGIIPQPDWRSTQDFMRLGRPRLFFGVTAGNLDSMVALYTAQRKIRSDDPYSEDGLTGKKPYLPTIIYTQRLKEIFKGVPVIIGGIEASLRRLAHYDYYTDTIKPSILLDSKADLLVYGNGEAPLKKIIELFQKSVPLEQMKNIPGTVVPVKQKEKETVVWDISLPSHEQVKSDKKKFNEMTRLLMQNLNPYNAKILYQDSGSKGILINPPSFPLTTEELDKIYELPFTRQAHSMYKKKIPALQVVETSIISHRGCYGGCCFCSLSLHQGKFIQSRSINSIEREINRLIKTNKPVIINDIGGPTANMYGTDCSLLKAQKECKRESCLFPTICIYLNVSQKKYRDLLKKIRLHPQVKAVYINSGIRYDLALHDEEFINDLIQYHTPGQLSIAPEHCDQQILKLMRKPKEDIFNHFSQLFYQKTKSFGKKQFLIPYFIIGHPGANDKTEYNLKQYIKAKKIKVEQIQEFYPTPMIVSTAMYYTGEDLFSNTKIEVEKKLNKKKQWKDEILKKEENLFSH